MTIFKIQNVSLHKLQVRTRVHGRVLGGGEWGGRGAGEQPFRGAVLWPHPSKEASLSASRHRPLLLHRQALHTAQTIRGHLSFHQ